MAPSIEELTERRRYIASEIFPGLDLGTFETYIVPYTFAFAPCEDCGGFDNCNDPGHHIRARVIAVDGACKDNGGPAARAACGIFYNVDSPLNDSFLLHEAGVRPTNQRAELSAAIKALTTAKELYWSNSGMHMGSELIVKTDSAYMFHGITNWINNWRLNGYIDTNKHPVANADLFRKLDRLIFDLHRGPGNVQVRFWLVRRDINKAADKLANAAFDGVTTSSITTDQLFQGGPSPIIRRRGLTGRLGHAGDAGLLPVMTVGTISFA
ncbi:hypothetical protein Q7P37_002575 [Cladosporium fusiforme]